MEKKYDIFISYRRSGGFESASLIAEKLRGMGFSVFFDIESLRSGKFNEQLYRVIEQCRDFVLVLPEKALDRCTNEDGSVNEEDWIRKEIMHAMEYDKNVVPVMLAGFEWPTKMPLGIESLKDYQSITATSHETFDLAMLRLAGYLKSKPNKFKTLKILASVIAVLLVVTVIGYLALLQVAKTVCSTVANEYTFGMELVYELRCDQENIKSEWDTFLSSYRMATTQGRKTNLESDILAYISQKEKDVENLQLKIRPVLTLSDWQTFLLGLYESQSEDVQALPLLVDNFVTDIDSTMLIIKRVVLSHTYKPSDVRNVSQHLDFYEHSVNMMYYTYLQEITRFPKGCLRTHDELSKSWNLLPTTSLELPSGEYEKLSQMELGKMEELMHKMETETTMKENETYDLEQRLDTLEAIANLLSHNNGLDDAQHPLYKVGDIIVRRNEQTITDYTSLSSAVAQNKCGTVEFLRMEGPKLVLHKENVPESTVLVGYMEVGEY